MYDINFPSGSNVISSNLSVDATNTLICTIGTEYSSNVSIYIVNTSVYSDALVNVNITNISNNQITYSNRFNVQSQTVGIINNINNVSETNIDISSMGTNVEIYVVYNPSFSQYPNNYFTSVLYQTLLNNGIGTTTQTNTLSSQQQTDETSISELSSTIGQLSSDILTLDINTNSTNISNMSSDIAAVTNVQDSMVSNIVSLSSQQEVDSTNISTLCSDIDTLINETANEILGNYVTQTDMTNGSITPEFNQIARPASLSNQNWLPNSSFLYGMTGWNNVPTDFDVSTIDNFTYGNYYGTDTSTQTVYSNNITQGPIISGLNYTLSGWIATAKSSGPASIYVNCYESDGTFISTICESTVAAGNAGEGVTATDAIPANTSYLVVYLSFTGDSSGSNISFSQLKLEIGSIATQWSDESSTLLFQNGFFEPTFNSIKSTNSNTLNGTSAGSIVYSMPEQGVTKKFVAYADGYENDTSTSQSITFPTAFANPPTVTTNVTGLNITVDTTTFTINAPNSTTTYSGVIIVEGI